MTPVLFAMVASFFAAIGARDQMTVAVLRERLGPSGALLAVALASATATATIAAWVGARLAAQLSDDASTMFITLALLLAAFDCAWPIRFRKPNEPTRSLGAIAIVLLARQLTDASRFALAALAVFFASTSLVALGGTIGGCLVVALGWSLGEDIERRVPLRALRLAMASILFVAACLVGLGARGLA